MTDLLTDPTYRRRLLAALVVLLAAAASAQPARPVSGIDALGVPVDSLTHAFAEAHGLPSLVLGVVVDGERRVVGAGEVNGTAPDAHTLYEIGSVTKVFTSLLLADAVVRGETTLETPLADVLGAPVGAHPDGPIRLVDLATHASGLPRLDDTMDTLPGFDLADPYAAYGAEHLLAFLASVEPATAPGQAQEYSNVGAGALGYVLARRAGSTYESLVAERVLAPLGLRETFATVPDSLADRFATGHDASGAATPHWTFQDATFGAGGLRSTAADMLTVAEAAIRPQATPLADAIALTLEPRVPVSGPVEQGLGWVLLPFSGGPTAAFHDGQTGGFVSFVAALPDDDIGLVVFTNRAADVSPLAFDVLGRLRQARAGR
ncbi:serine hydrolase domain-containing protein [Rubrivirga sp. IMCC45206]|uniref:serine hydrolase domain-containing protein n=1 Tax=Rubrivirga sp. IMCC45206 TaxID=3391614 RepID=UPI00398F98EE